MNESACLACHLIPHTCGVESLRDTCIQLTALINSMLSDRSDDIRGLIIARAVQAVKDGCIAMPTETT